MAEKTDNRRILARSEVPGAVFDLYENNFAPEIFCDGMSGASINGEITRLMMHVVTEPISPTQEREGRTLAVKIVIPTHAAIEFAQKLLEAYIANQSQLLSSIDAQKKAVADMLTKYTPTHGGGG
jgi:hypothetical protein